MRWKIAPMYRENHTVQHEKKRRNMCRTMVAPWSRVCNAARNNRWWSNTGRRPVQNQQDKYLAFPWHKRQNKLLKYVDPIHQTCASVGNYRFFETKHCGVNKNAPVVRGVRGKEKSAMSGEHANEWATKCSPRQILAFKMFSSRSPKLELSTHHNWSCWLPAQAEKGK